MLHILQNSTAGANSCSAMEADTISKNGRSSKSQTSRIIKKALVMLITTTSVLSMNAQTDTDNDLPHGKTFKRNAFGVDIGIGAVKGIQRTYADLGIRYLHNFSPYVGWEVLKLKVVMSVSPFDRFDNVVQLMTGIRGTSPAFYGNMSGYGAFRFGYASDLDYYLPAYELEVGVNITPTISVGYAYNMLKDVDKGYSALRVGFNLGKEKEFIRKAEGLFLDFGIGALSSTSTTKINGNSNTSTTDAIGMADIGLRYLAKTSISKYLWWDVFKIRSTFLLKNSDSAGDVSDLGDHLNLQIMTGVRGISPTFYKDMSGYASFKPGVGLKFSPDFTANFCFELELGVNITKNFLVGYSYDFQKEKTIEVDIPGGKSTTTSHSNYSSLRIGFSW